MRIITQAIRVIDYENDQILAREIMPEFGNYIQQLVSYIQTNVSVRLPLPFRQSMPRSIRSGCRSSGRYRSGMRLKYFWSLKVGRAVS